MQAAARATRSAQGAREDGARSLRGSGATGASGRLTRPGGVTGGARAPCAWRMGGRRPAGGLWPVNNLFFFFFVFGAVARGGAQ